MYTQALDERYSTLNLVLQNMNNLLSSSRECDVNLTAAVSILSLVVMNFGNQTVEKPIIEVCRRKTVAQQCRVVAICILCIC